MIWFTSDLHFCDKKLIANRQFKTTKEMNLTLANNFNSVVNPKDTVYFLGDVGVGSKKGIEKTIKHLNGNKILIRGNHDKDYSDSNIFEHISDIEHITIDGYKFVLCHYKVYLPLKDTIILSGHAHVKKDWNDKQLKDGSLNFNVNVDANNYYPVSAEQLINRFKTILEKK